MKNYNLVNVIENDVQNLDDNEQYYSYNMLKNLLVICLNKHTEIEASKVIKILNEIFSDISNIDNVEINKTNVDNTENINDNIENMNVDDSENIEEYDYFNTDIYNNTQYVLNIYEILKQFDKMYFYDLRKDFIDILYRCFHNTNVEQVKIASLECAKYFKITLLFRNRLDSEELKFYTKHK